MERLLLAAVIVVVAAAAGEVIRRRRRFDPPTQPRRELPTQLDRADFDDPAVPWLVAVFSSESCSTCADVVAKAEVLRSHEVTVDIVAYQSRRDIHARYAIDAVPCLVVADAAGEVRSGFLGPVTATDLWASVAEARRPGSIDRAGGCDRHEHD